MLSQNSNKIPLLITYGSQTGNTEAIAILVGQTGEKNGFLSSLHPLNYFHDKTIQLSSLFSLIVILLE